MLMRNNKDGENEESTAVTNNTWLSNIKASAYVYKPPVLGAKMPITPKRRLDFSSMVSDLGSIDQDI